MTKEEAKEMLPIIQAFLEGRTIERKTRSWELNKGWRDKTQWEETEELIFRNTFVYRIKPEPKYRPFANAEECWKEMQKHQPFGWIKSGNCYYNVVSISYIDVNIISLSGIVATLSFSNLVGKEYHFVDGYPFGVKEEE